MNEEFKGQLRHVLTVIGTAIISVGWISNEIEPLLPTVIGAIVGIAGFVMSFLDKKKTKAKVQALEAKIQSLENDA